jgi:hypothetical protein
LCDAIVRFEGLSFDERALRGNASRFAPERFAEAFGELLLGLTDPPEPADNLASR